MAVVALVAYAFGLGCCVGSGLEGAEEIAMSIVWPVSVPFSLGWHFYMWPKGPDGLRYKRIRRERW